MELLKCTTAGIQLSNSFVLPVIRAVIKDMPTSISKADYFSLMQQIFERSEGCVSVSGFFTDVSSSHLSIANGTRTYGDSNGFYVTQNASKFGTGSRMQQINYVLYYKGNGVCECRVYTGYSSYEYSLGVLFTDENYNIILPSSNNTSGFAGVNIRSAETLGIAVENNVSVLANFKGGTVTNIGQNGYSSIRLNYENIKDYVVREIDPTKTDPYYPGGESTTGGGEGDFDGTSDPIDFPSLPALSAVDTGFITLFNPNITQLKRLADYMWSNSLFDLDTWKKIFADPMDAILGLTIVPVNVPAGSTGVVTVGNIPTDVSMTYAATQYVEVDCGSINVNEYWGSYLDYAPYTKAEIYLPYIGTHAINTDDIMDKTVHVKYHVDILSGACAAYVKCGESVLYTFIGQCASSIPITGSDMTNVINGVISAAASIGSMIATGGATAPLAVPSLASTAVNGMKPSVEKSGSMAGTGGMLGIQKPYLILTRPRQCLPAIQNVLMGYPSFIAETLGDLSGYTEVEQVFLDGISATDVELSEIESLLKSGVFL